MIPHISTPLYKRSGPWQNEPNVEVWEHGELRCCVLRLTTGYLAGYVGVPIGHWLYGASLNTTIVQKGAATTLSTIIGERFLLDFAEVGIDRNYWFGFAANGYSPAEDKGDPDYYVSFECVRETVDGLAKAIEDLWDTSALYKQLHLLADTLPEGQRILLKAILP